MSFLALSARESSLVQTFCESCVRLDITHQSVHMARRFVIQGCPTLKFHVKFYTIHKCPAIYNNSTCAWFDYKEMNCIQWRSQAGAHALATRGRAPPVQVRKHANYRR